MKTFTWYFLKLVPPIAEYLKYLAWVGIVNISNNNGSYLDSDEY